MHRLQQYLRFFGISDREALVQSDEEIIAQLPVDISYQTEQFANRLRIKITRHCLSGQFINLQVRLGYFIFKRVSIIHINRQSPVHEVHNCGSGGYCTVYYCECGGIMLAFKCFYKKHFTFSDATTSLLETVIEEYCLLRLASCFKIGPKIARTLGFDIMIYPDCIQICMECCEPLPPKCKPTIKEQLKRQLLTLHRLHIIHHDIKEDNICFSPAFNSLVFIDFGMSRINKEEIGFKSATKYRGTLHYCGDEMASLLEKNRKDIHHIDLYFNDMIGLQKTFEDLRYQDFQNEIVRISLKKRYQGISDYRLDPFYRLCTIKHQIFNNKYDVKALEMLDTSQLISIFRFIGSLFYSPFINTFHLQLRKIIKKKNTIFGQENQLSLREYSKISDQEEKYPLPEYVIQTISNLTKITYRSIDYYHDAYAGFDQLLNFLKNLQQSNRFISLEDYLCLLAKAIRLNSSTVKLLQLNDVCLAAQRMSEQFNAMRFDTKYSHEDSSCFFLATEFLFTIAIRHQLKRKYFNVYCSVINNILAFNMLSNNQLMKNYDTIIRLPLCFENKLLAVLRFHTGLVWMYINARSLDQYIQIKQQLYLRSNIYLTQQKQLSDSEAQLLKVIWSKQRLKQYQLKNKSLISPNTKLQLKIWLLFQEGLKMKFNAKVQKQIKQTNSELILQDTFIEYYHFYTMIFSYMTDRQNIDSSLIQRYRSAFRGRLNNMFVLAIQNAKMLRSEKYKHIEERLSIFWKLTSCSHPLTNFIIYNQMQYLYTMNSPVFRQFNREIKAQIFKLAIYSHSIYVKCGNETLVDQLMSLTRKVVKQTEIYWRYLEDTGHQIAEYRLQQDKAKYFEIINKINQAKITGQASKQHKLNSLLALTGLLIKKKDIKKAVQLAKNLYRITNFTSTEKINKRKVLSFIFHYLISKYGGGMNYRDINRQLYFDYAKILQEEDKEEYYVHIFSVFADTVAMMFQCRFDLLNNFITRISKKVQIMSSKSNSQRYYIAINMAFFQVRKQPINRYKLSILQRQLSNIDISYNIFPLVQIFWPNNQNTCQFIRLFTFLRFVNIFAREMLLHRLYPTFVFFYKNRLLPRRRLKLICKAIAYNFAILSDKQLMKLLISPNSLKLLRTDQNSKKKNGFRRVLKRYNEIILTDFDMHVSKVSVSYMNLKICQQ